MKFGVVALLLSVVAVAACEGAESIRGNIARDGGPGFGGAFGSGGSGGIFGSGGSGGFGTGGASAGSGGDIGSGGAGGSGGSDVPDASGNDVSQGTGGRDAGRDVRDSATRDVVPEGPTALFNCYALKPYQKDEQYGPGARIFHLRDLRVYQCRPWPNSGWCPLPAYEPGTPPDFWLDAWTVLGYCE